MIRGKDKAWSGYFLGYGWEPNSGWAVWRMKRWKGSLKYVVSSLYTAFFLIVGSSANPLLDPKNLYARLFVDGVFGFGGTMLIFLLLDKWEERK